VQQIDLLPQICGFSSARYFRFIFSAPTDVLMLFNPTTLLSASEGDKVLLVLRAFAERGGLWGILDPSRCEQQGETASHYLTGNGPRTVIFTLSSREEALGVPDVVSDVVYCAAAWEACTLTSEGGEAEGEEGLGRGRAEASARLRAKDADVTASLGFPAHHILHVGDMDPASAKQKQQQPPPPPATAPELAGTPRWEPLLGCELSDFSMCGC